MIKTILCAVDISTADRDKWTLQAADGLARHHQAQLDVITVLPEPARGPAGAHLNDHKVRTASEVATEALNSFGQSVLGATRNRQLRHVVVTGRVYQEVLRVAGKDQADLIVIGAQNDDVTDFLLGTNAARVVRHASCSVYVVR